MHVPEVRGDIILMVEVSLTPILRGLNCTGVSVAVYATY